jgi:molybdopterin molybdotransferase
MTPAIEPSADWLGYEEALEAILTRSDSLGEERVPLHEALGRAIARSVHSPIDHPAWDNSAMDGFAVRTQDVEGAAPDRPVTLPISESIRAGRFPQNPLSPGTAVQVMTGAPVPLGATGVIRVEHTDGGDGDRITIHDAADAERHIRPAGEDMVRGQLLLSAGDEVTPAAVGILALAGFAELDVGRVPRVGVLANGDELADFDAYDEVLAGRKVMNSNEHALRAQLRSVCAEPVSLGIARDDPADLREHLARGAECDAIISAAGVSVGEHDHVKSVLEELGMERLFWRVRMRPGSAALFGLQAGRPVWGVPGNPVSAMVTFEVLIRPAIRRMSGHRDCLPRRVRAAVNDRVSSPAGTTSFLRAHLSGGGGRSLTASLTGPQGSGMLTSMLADALVVVPEEVTELPAGSEVELIPLTRWFEAGPAVGGDV